MSELRYGAMLVGAPERPLSASLRAILELRPPGVGLDLGPAPEAFGTLLSSLGNLRVPVWAVTVPRPLVGAESESQPFDRVGQDLSERLTHLDPWIDRWSALRLRHWIIDLGVEPEVPGVPAPRNSDEWQARKAADRRARERAALDIVRVLFAASRRHPHLRWLLRPSARPMGILDLEFAGWVLSEIPSAGLAVDTGRLGVRALGGAEPASLWFESYASRLELLVHSDRGRDGEADWPLGAGISLPDSLRDLAPRSTKKLLLASPRFPSSWLAEADRVAVERFGTPASD